MSKHINEIPTERHRETKKISPDRANEKPRFTPASREEWAEVLATADKYY